MSQLAAMCPLIVLADDSAELRELLAGALERVGYRVVQASTGAGLVEVVRRLAAEGEQVRLVITDVQMPGRDGGAAAAAIRAAGLAAPLIFMTAYGDAWTRARAEQLGAVLLAKPLGLGALRHAVRGAIVESAGPL